MSSLEIFSGAGGLATGIAQNNVKHHALVEWNKDACRTLMENFDPKIVHNVDIRDFEFIKYGHVDIVAGGPPCQPFSLGGKHKGSIDTRDMFPYACKAISQCKPLAFIFENVKGLLRKSFSTYFEYIILRLTYPEIEIEDSEPWEKHLNRLEKIHTSQNYNGIRYNVLFRLIDAADYGIPQRRERVIIVGIREDLGIEWSFPPQTHSLEALIWSQFVSHEYWERHNIIPVNVNCYDERTQTLIAKAQQQVRMFPPGTKPWRTIRDQLKDIPQPDEHGTFHSEHILRDGARVYPGHTGSFIDFPSKTLKAGDHGVPGGENMIRYDDGRVRYYTTYEAKLIQTFPSNYKICGSWTESMRQIGNAVPVKLAQIISNSIIKQIAKCMDAQQIAARRLPNAGVA
ncbi:DNA cytosine methyltransferase [Myxococcota bacterium]|nr:DNA cytosine methyltransferase [Myxococcota bacterium]